MGMEKLLTYLFVIPKIVEHNPSEHFMKINKRKKKWRRAKLILYTYSSKY